MGDPEVPVEESQQVAVIPSVATNENLDDQFDDLEESEAAPREDTPVPIEIEENVSDAKMTLFEKRPVSQLSFGSLSDIFDAQSGNHTHSHTSIISESILDDMEENTNDKIESALNLADQNGILLSQDPIFVSEHKESPEELVVNEQESREVFNVKQWRKNGGEQPPKLVIEGPEAIRSLVIQDRVINEHKKSSEIDAELLDKDDSVKSDVDNSPQISPKRSRVEGFNKNFGETSGFGQQQFGQAIY
uniref:Uncharacterized protein n=1 Tax=Acrobeloides nanus TaxID=290746 RepID=A0A914DKP2_9BILA